MVDAITVKHSLQDVWVKVSTIKQLARKGTRRYILQQ